MIISEYMIEPLIKKIIIQNKIKIDNITTLEWVNIVKTEFCNTYNLNPEHVRVGYIAVLHVLNHLVSGEGYYNPTTDSYYVKGDDFPCLSDSTLTKYTFFYT